MKTGMRGRPVWEGVEVVRLGSPCRGPYRSWGGGSTLCSHLRSRWWEPPDPTYNQPSTQCPSQPLIASLSQSQNHASKTRNESHGRERPATPLTPSCARGDTPVCT